MRISVRPRDERGPGRFVPVRPLLASRYSGER